MNPVSMSPNGCGRMSGHRMWPAVILLAALLTGCNFGPSQMERGHLAYNEALRSSGDDEILLNIVRLRYLDTVEFMSISSISSQLEFTVTVGASAGDTADLGRIAFGTGEATYSTRPTFTFIPQRSSEFAKRLVEPVDAEILADLIGADWDINLLFRLLVRSMNGQVNEIGLPNSMFNETAARLGRMQAKAQLYIGYVPRIHTLSDPIDENRVTGTDLVEAARAGYRFSREDDGEDFVLTASRPQPVLGFTPAAEEVDAVIRALDLPADGRPYYDLNEGTRIGATASDSDDVLLRTRSLLGAILYLAHGVKIPDKHVEAGWTTTQWPPGIDHDLDIDDFFEVRSSEQEPDAELSVRYRGYWFYVDNADVNTRITFLHIAELFRLALLRETEGQQAPVLTLPVGG